MSKRDMEPSEPKYIWYIGLALQKFMHYKAIKSVAAGEALALLVLNDKSAQLLL